MNNISPATAVPGLDLTKDYVKGYTNDQLFFISCAASKLF
jgi:hypothetical protein